MGPRSGMSVEVLSPYRDSIPRVSGPYRLRYLGLHTDIMGSSYRKNKDLTTSKTILEISVLSPSSCRVSWVDVGLFIYLFTIHSH